MDFDETGESPESTRVSYGIFILFLEGVGDQ